MSTKAVEIPPEEKKETRHKIGCARTIQTAVLVCAYLRDRYSLYPWKDTIKYVFTDPTPGNGFWTADIIVSTWGWTTNAEQADISAMVNECRAFVAGRGEVWA